MREMLGWRHVSRCIVEGWKVVFLCEGKELLGGNRTGQILVVKEVVDGVVFFFQAEDGIRDIGVTGVQTCALPIFVQALDVLVSAWLVVLEAPVPHELRQVLVTALRLRKNGWRDRVVCGPEIGPREIRRASCRESVEISVVAVSLKKKPLSGYTIDC